MNVGQTLEAGAVVWSPWFPRGADNGVFTYELIDTGASATLTVAVFHKNTDETGPGADTSASWADVDSNTNFQAAKVTDLKEMVRFKYTAATSWVLYRMLTPQWFETPNA